MKLLLIATVVILLGFIKVHSSESSSPSQTARGKVVNYQTQQPIPGATVRILETNLGAYTNTNGDFRIDKVPVGRHILTVSTIGFEPYRMNIVLSSGKELQLNIQINESFIQTEEIDIVASKNSFAPINEAALVSSTVFTFDDVQKFAGSRMDPARMAQNFAGVVGADDRRNDIIIRGGSPTELLWRLDGLDIPNPNHFATQGATGGPINAINSLLLDNSDFFTGAFPAEYGTKMSGVFDLRTRQGNKEKYEFVGQFGFNGLEAGAEGPLPKGSFIANYRYSFLDLLEKIGVDFGFSGVPRYEDAVLKLDFAPTNRHKVSVTGLLGISGIEMLQSKKKDVNTGDFNTNNKTDVFSLGLNWQYLFNDKLYGKLTTGAVYNKYFTLLDSITTDGNHNVTGINPWFNQNSGEGYYTVKYALNYSPNVRNFISIGLENRISFYDFKEERFGENTNLDDLWYLFKSGDDYSQMGYFNWNYRITEDLTTNVGLYSMHSNVNKQVALDPRFGLEWRFLPLHTFSLGWGIHSQVLPLVLIYSQEVNEKAKFMQSTHYVAGYSWQFSSDAIIKLEGYYKSLSNAPVERDTLSSWSFLNSGVSYGIVDGAGRKIVSDGIGKCYGAELSLVKHFSNNYYINATASYVRQQYRASDGIWRWGSFDNIYIFNLLAGYEWVISPDFALEFAGRYTLAGGNPYTPLDLEKSKYHGRTYYDNKNAFSLRNPDYSRFDIRADFRHNMKNVAVISYVSIENLFNSFNVFYRYYNNARQEEQVASQLGFFFVGGIRVEF